MLALHVMLALPRLPPTNSRPSSRARLFDRYAANDGWDEIALGRSRISSDSTAGRMRAHHAKVSPHRHAWLSEKSVPGGRVAGFRADGGWDGLRLGP